MAEIQVGDRYVAIVDDRDLALVQRYHWLPVVKGNGKLRRVYARAWTGDRSEYMHRLILGAKDGQLVDHRDHDGLNNRRGNLRFCSKQQNQFNARTHSRNIVGLKGVGPTVNGKWRARATLNKKTVLLGVFDTPLEASTAYQEFARKHHAEFFCAQ